MKKLLGRFLGDRRGAFAMQLALMVIPLVICTGLAIDGGRLLLVRYALNSTVDAAGLAVGSTFGTTTELNTITDTYAARNFRVAGATLVRPVHPVITPQDITVTAFADVDMMFMGLVGQNTVRVRAESEVRRSSSGLLVAMVLDVTGSMWTQPSGSSITNIQALKNSAGSLVEELFGSNSTHSYLRMAIVPYSFVVNMGDEAVENSTINTHSFGSRLATWTSTSGGWWGCVFERAGADSLSDTAPTNAATRWNAYRWDDTVDNNWLNSSGAQDIDHGPGPTSVAYRGPNLGCGEEILPLTNVKQAALDKITALQATVQRGGTLTDIGLAWGRRVLTPGLPFDEATEIDPVNSLTLWASPRWRKAIVLMTDGDSHIIKQNMSGASPNGVNNAVSSDMTAYGRTDDALAQGIFGSTNYDTIKSQLNTRIENLCTEIKGQGVIIYTVVFTSSVAQSVRDMYQRCATDAGKYWYAPNQTALQGAFDQIGEDLSRLRLSR